MTHENNNREHIYSTKARRHVFDSLWHGPENVEAGYYTFGEYYRWNYLKHLPKDKDIEVLVVSCGPGYYVRMLNKNGYRNVLGIDADPEKVKHATRHGLNCIVARAFSFLNAHQNCYDLIVLEQDINHLSKDEMWECLELCRQALRPGGMLTLYGLNAANPITGSASNADDFDHHQRLTEFSMRQALEWTGYEGIRILPLNIYVFWKNPLNYLGLAVTSLFTLFFRLCFSVYGKRNRIFTKKIGAIAQKSRSPE
ncbi:MAG: class I SAM-dependent methyltransferase [Gammaproteobacteria bacterium]|jgi:2-polyprenyl-3-methyl-5-hydroxy-6-metoxy-1,4-benzoquinol methylase